MDLVEPRLSISYRSLLVRESLSFVNTLRDDTYDKLWTCHYFLQHPPKQIDHFLWPVRCRNNAVCETFDSTATTSDHRPNILTYMPPGVRNSEYWRLKTGPPKPVGWSPESAELFNPDVVDFCECNRDAARSHGRAARCSVDDCVHANNRMLKCMGLPRGEAR